MKGGYHESLAQADAGVAVAALWQGVATILQATIPGMTLPGGEFVPTPYSPYAQINGECGVETEARTWDGVRNGPDRRIPRLHSRDSKNRRRGQRGILLSGPFLPP